MTIRKVSYTAFRRNMSFWIGRQERGEEIHLLQMGRVVGALHGALLTEEPNRNPSPRLRLHNIISV